MNDLKHASTFFLIFACVLALYGVVLARTGNKDLIPYRALHSIHGPQEVQRVGHIVVRVGLVIAVLAAIVRLLARQG